VTVRSNEPERLEDEERENILYDPNDPDCAVPIDGLPGPFDLESAGRVVAMSPRVLLVLPAATLLVNAWFVWRNL